MLHVVLELENFGRLTLRLECDVVEGLDGNQKVFVLLTHPS